MFSTNLSSSPIVSTQKRTLIGAAGFSLMNQNLITVEVLPQPEAHCCTKISFPLFRIEIRMNEVVSRLQGFKLQVRERL